MPNKDLFVEELAETINRLFEDESTDPRAKEIAEAHFPDRALPGDIIEAVRKRLKQVRDRLEEDYQHPAHLVSRTYYARFRRDGPRTEEDARLCLPLGRNKSSEGVRLPSGEDDPIWQATMAQNLGAGAGKVGKSLERIEDALDDERLGPEKAERLLEKLQRAEPLREELQKRLEDAATPKLARGPEEAGGTE